MFNKILTHSPKLIIGLLFLASMAAIVQAQPQTKLASLIIQIWPEYDRPEALLIFRGEVDPSAAMPVTLTFRIPAHVQSLNAVAVFNEQGSLVNNEFDFTPGGESGLLTFTTDRPRFQFEYYDPDVVVIQPDNPQRSFNFSAVAAHPIADLQIEIRQPLEARAMQLSPQPDETFTGPDQFTYYLYQRNNLAANDSVLVAGGYEKDTATLATDLQVDISQPSAPASSRSGGQANPLTIGYILVGVGVVVLFAAAGYWWYNNQRPPLETDPQRRPVRKKRAGKAPAPKPVRPNIPPQTSQSASQSKFCHQCGSAYKDNARFCHQCGAERR